MTKIELIKKYIRDYIKDNNVTGDDIRRLYDEAWDVCKGSIACTKSMFIMYMNE